MEGGGGGNGGGGGVGVLNKFHARSLAGSIVVALDREMFGEVSSGSVSKTRKMRSLTLRTASSRQSLSVS
jgi:hypothetical protein